MSTKMKAMQSSFSNDVSPNYSITFTFEEKHDPKAVQQWFAANWHLSFYFSAVYLLLVFGGKEYMKKREAYKLRKLLVAWNLFLAAFSIFGASRTLPEMYHVLTKYGFDHSACNPSYAEQVKVSGEWNICKPSNEVVIAFWTWLFTLSKIPELGDTLFVILRKQSLQLLHWYHHVTVFMFCWYSYPEHFSTARWSVCMNYTVHAVMYSYYAIRAFGYRPPRWTAMFITFAQTAQMVVGLLVNSYAFHRKLNNHYCNCHLRTLSWALVLYGSYFVLFARYFHNAYFSKERKKNE